jgi:hypothetical protein
MYSRYVSVLKILQWIGYAISVVSGITVSFIVGLQFGGGGGFMAFLFSAVGGCIFTYLSTQGLISIVDLLNKIEANTKRIP